MDAKTMSRSFPPPRPSNTPQFANLALKCVQVLSEVRQGVHGHRYPRVPEITLSDPFWILSVTVKVSQISEEKDAKGNNSVERFGDFYQDFSPAIMVFEIMLVTYYGGTKSAKNQKRVWRRNGVPVFSHFIELV